MTRDEFDAALDGLALNQTAFAALVGLDRQTVYGWGKERTVGPGNRRAYQPVPAWVPVMLESWRLAPPRVLAAIRKRLDAPA